jgi:hypothetical protein
MSDPKLNLEVQTSIVVTMPGTNFKVAFEKLSAELMMDDKDAGVSRHEFLAATWHAATPRRENSPGSCEHGG